MNDFFLYWLCAAFLVLPSAAIIPAMGAVAIALFAAGFWFCTLLNNTTTNRKETI